MFESRLRQLSEAAVASAAGVGDLAPTQRLPRTRAVPTVISLTATTHEPLSRVVDELVGLELAQALAARTAWWTDTRTDSRTSADTGITDTGITDTGDTDTDDLLSLAVGWEKVAGWVAASQRRAVAALAVARDDEAPRQAVAETASDSRAGQVIGQQSHGFVSASGAASVEPHEYVAHELALALRCSVRSAETLVWESRDLVEALPRTLDALSSGTVSPAAAKAVVQETIHLEPRHRSTVESLVLSKAGARTPAQTRAATRRAVLAADPAAGQRRESAARSRRCVTTRPGPDGMADLTIQAWVGDVAGAFEHLDSRARELVSRPSESRGIEAVRADLAIAALGGEACLLRDPLHAAAASLGERQTPGVQPPRRRSVRAEVVVTGAATTLAGQDDEPGHLTGYGPVTAQTLREICGTAGIVDVLVTDADSGSVTDVLRVRPRTRRAVTGARSTEADAAGIGAAGIGAAGSGAAGSGVVGSGVVGSGAAGAAARPTSTSAAGTGAAGTGARSTEVGAAGTSPTGSWPGQPRGPAASTRTGSAPADSAPGGSASAGSVSADTALTPQVPKALPESRYEPSAELSRFVVARDRTCRFPGCRRRADRSDLDHTVRYPEGPTSADNLGALCRRHHRIKHTPGWELRQSPPGTFTWRTPTGRTYRVEPPDPLDTG